MTTLTFGVLLCRKVLSERNASLLFLHFCEVASFIIQPFTSQTMATWHNKLKMPSWHSQVIIMRYTCCHELSQAAIHVCHTFQYPFPCNKFHCMNWLAHLKVKILNFIFQGHTWGDAPYWPRHQNYVWCHIYFKQIFVT